MQHDGVLDFLVHLNCSSHMEHGWIFPTSNSSHVFKYQEKKKLDVDVVLVNLVAKIWQVYMFIMQSQSKIMETQVKCELWNKMERQC